MILRSITLMEFENDPREWFLKDCSFGNINLIVGQNATGKSRTLNVIKTLKKIILNEKDAFISNCSYEVIFSNENKITYTYKSNNREIEFEKLVIDNNEKFIRGKDGKGKIFYNSSSSMMDFKISTRTSVIKSKLDSEQHPFLDSLYSWGANIVFFMFGTGLGRTSFFPINLFSKKDINELNGASVLAYMLLEKDSNFKKCLIEDMNKLGYEIEDVGVGFPDNVVIESNIPLDKDSIVAIYVKEKSLACKTYQHSMSQGMFRALVLLGNLNYFRQTNLPSCILIDDIGEGLDYERSKDLIKILIESATETNIQLIMSTNDRFVMNNVPLEYWIVIQRKNNICTTLDYRNSKDIFDKFDFTGLSNFDFFSSKYYQLKEGDNK